MYMKALALYLLALVAMNLLNEMKADSGDGSIFFPITGSVHLGFYTVNMSIGKYPSKTFVLNIYTGSDLTWVPCVDGNNTSYNPNANVTCGDDCQSPDVDQCEYSIAYADRGSSDGVLVRDSIPLTFGNGTPTAANLTFGCGISSTDQNIVDGVLGLGKGKPGILRQLSNMSVIRNAFGHCLNGQGGGYLFFGNFPNSGVTWKQISGDNDQYYLGSADILLDGEATGITGLGINFDSGKTYTYFASDAYGAFLDRVTKKLNGSLNSTESDQTLPVCWHDHVRPIKTIGQVASYFMNVTLNFTDANNNVQFEMLPESYLIISGNQNVCLGILNSTAFGLEDKNLIGDISMQNKLVIYDNEGGKVGWTAVEPCYRLF